MDERISKAQIAERLLTRPGGATMHEIIAATGGPQYNELRRLGARGYRIRKVKEGSETRYFANPPEVPFYEATVTSKGQVTIPKEIREHLGIRAGGKLKMVLHEGHQVIVTPRPRSIRDLAGILGKPPRSLTLKEIDEAVAQAAVERYRRATR